MIKLVGRVDTTTKKHAHTLSEGGTVSETAIRAMAGTLLLVG